MTVVRIDTEKSADRIARDIETLATSDYTLSDRAICRYAYTDAYHNTLDYFRRQVAGIGFETYLDPVGTLVCRNRPRGQTAFGLGSHCDSNRNGGKFDGTLGVVTALEVCRLNHELGLGFPLQLISFLEEEGSGFGQMLLGSRITSQRVAEEDLRERFLALDDGRTFWEHATEAGHQPERWRDCIQILEDLAGWIEMHIEQGRVLQDNGDRIGVVTAIAGYVHADLAVTGRADHAGATPMDLRRDAGVVAAECVLELERLARDVGSGTVGTVGEIQLVPGLINVVPGEARLSLDIRGVDEEAFRGVAERISAFAAERAGARDMEARYSQRQALGATPLDRRVVGALEEAVKATREPYRLMPSGAAHDTMCVAPHVPSAMVFVPCRDGISHSPLEHAEPADAALAAEIILNAVGTLLPE